jgi:hypothetical protein
LLLVGKVESVLVAIKVQFLFSVNASVAYATLRYESWEEGEGETTEEAPDWAGREGLGRGSEEMNHPVGWGRLLSLEHCRDGLTEKDLETQKVRPEPDRELVSTSPPTDARLETQVGTSSACCPNRAGK